MLNMRLSQHNHMPVAPELNMMRTEVFVNNAFDKLAIETNQYIASLLDSDRDLVSYRITCRSTFLAVDADNNTYWRRRFLSRFEKPRWSIEGNLKFKTEYQNRKQILRKGAQFRFGDTHAERRCLEALKDLVLDAFSGKTKNTDRRTEVYGSANLTEIRRFITEHNILRIVFKPQFRKGRSRDRSLQTRPTPLLAMIQLLMAPDLLSLSSNIANDSFSFPDSQQWVYGTAKSHPLFGGCSGLDVNLEYVLHQLNFWKYHMLRPDELTLHNALSALDIHDRPRFWSSQLRQGTKQLGKHWKGSYAYLHREMIADLRAGGGHIESIQDSINKEGEVDAFQNLSLRFVPEGQQLWPPAFERHLHSTTPTANHAKTRAQHRVSTGPEALVCHKPESFHFDGEGNDENDIFNAMGWLNSLPPQLEVPGWQRMTMMKYFTDQSGDIDMDALWAYEGVVLPGGQVMLGRWWAADDGTSEDDMYSGPFILWNVDGPAYPDGDEAGTGE